MKSSRLWLAAVLGLALATPAARAQCYYPIPTAPDMCGPGFYCNGICGMVYGPNYCPYPPFAPFQGMVPGPPPPKGPCGPGGGPLGSPVFPTHPYARSPRDYFMIYDRGRLDEHPY
jgi:hypothetical protein